MLVEVLASGSKANSTLVKCGTSYLLIDLGINYNQLKSALKKHSLLPKDLDFILISHGHTDHIKGLAPLVRKTNIEVYTPFEVCQDLSGTIPVENLRAIPEKFSIQGIDITCIKTSHDAKGSTGYLLEYDNKSMVQITDTGYINEKHFKTIKNKNIYVLEANHDEELLMNGPYPYFLKQRILSDKGHIPNHKTAEYLCKVIGPNTSHVVLAHLSETNNDPDIAYDTVYDKLCANKKHNVKLIIAKQYEETEIIEV